MSATPKLNLRLMQDSDIFAGGTINAIVSDIDDKVLGIGHAKSKVHFDEWMKNTDYQVDDLVRVDGIPSWGVWVCITPGTSGSTPPSGSVEDMTFNDGTTVVWKLRKIVNEGVTIHNKLNGRGVNDAHPISAITGLQALLDTLITAVDAKAYTDTKIADLIAGAPSTLDTLKEIADALAADDNAISALTTLIDTKVDKVAGKGLSTNDYTDADKAKVDYLTVTAPVNLDTLKAQSHAHSNKTQLDKIGEDANGNFTYNSKTIVGGASEWTQNTPYGLDQLVTHNNLLYKCLLAHTSTATFDKTKWQMITLGYIADWIPNHYYNQYEVTIQGNSIIRCIAAHTSGASYDSTENNYWEVIANKGAVVAAWKPNTPYGIDEAVVYNDVIYISNMSHTSGLTFSSDMITGAEKWHTLNTGGVAGELKQVTRLGVVGTTLVEIVINNTLTFNLPPVEILKFVAGAQDQVITEFTFSASDGSSFNANGISAETSPYITFDGTVHPTIAYSYQAVKSTTFTGTGQYSEDSNIDDTVFKLIESGVV